jgi:hypothetical protein
MPTSSKTRLNLKTQNKRQSKMKTEKKAKETHCLQACKQTKPQINNKQNQQT